MKKCIFVSSLALLTIFASPALSDTTKNLPVHGPGDQIDLPEPYATESVSRRTEVVGWPDNQKPVAPDGFTVTKFADDLNHPRWIYVLDNGDVLVAEGDTYSKNAAVRAAQKLSDKSGNRIILLRDIDNDGKAEERHVFLKDLNQPFGMTVLNGYFYVANTDSIMRYPYEKGTTRITGAGTKILDLPAGGYNHHWTRNLMTGKDGKKLLLTVGSSSNVGEHGMDKEKRRAKIFTLNPDGTEEKVFASGLRNPNGMDYNPVTGELWTAVNERDKLGNNLVPDYVTSVKEGAFYGWPYKYFGDHVDPRWADRMPQNLPAVTIPDYAVGAHTSSIGLTFYTGNTFPQKYRNGLFIGQHGSWNRANYSGYKVLFLPFVNGEPSGPAEDFLTGFLKDAENDEAYGRPVAVRQDADGDLLVADDDGNAIWHVSPEKTQVEDSE